MRNQDQHEKIEAFVRGKIPLVAVFGDLNATDQFHDEVGAAGGSAEWGVRSAEWPSPLIPLPSDGRGESSDVTKVVAVAPASWIFAMFG